MTAFDLFQLANREKASGKLAAAAATMTEAIRLIDADGEDADLRADLVARRRDLTERVSA